MRGRSWGVASSFAAATVLALTVGPAAARADTETWTLTTINGPGYAGPYSTVSMTLTSSNTVDVTFTSLSNGGYVYLMGDGQSAALNVASAVSVSNIVGTNSYTGFANPSGTPFLVDLNKNADGWGPFTVTIKSFDGFTHSSSQISFTLTKSSGTWSSVNDVLTPNSKGNILAAHVFACSLAAVGGCTASQTLPLGSTLYSSGAVPAPEPRVLSLLGVLGGLMAAVVRLRRGVA